MLLEDSKKGLQDCFIELSVRLNFILELSINSAAGLISMSYAKSMSVLSEEFRKSLAVPHFQL